MDIKEVKESIRKASHDIENILDNLQTTTGLNIKGIDCNCSMTISGKTYIENVNIEVGL